MTGSLRAEASRGCPCAAPPGCGASHRGASSSIWASRPVVSRPSVSTAGLVPPLGRWPSRRTSGPRCWPLPGREKSPASAAGGLPALRSRQPACLFPPRDVRAPRLPLSPRTDAPLSESASGWPRSRAEPQGFVEMWGLLWKRGRKSTPPFKMLQMFTMKWVIQTYWTEERKKWREASNICPFFLVYNF